MSAWQVAHQKTFTSTSRRYQFNNQYTVNELDRLEELIRKAIALRHTDLTILPCAKDENGDRLLSNLHVLKHDPWNGFYYLDHCSTKGWGLLITHKNETQQAFGQLFQEILSVL